MPPETHTPIRNVRVPDDIWDHARILATRRGETLSNVIRDALTEYIRKGSLD